LIALEFVDKLFEACPQLQFSIFNKRVLLPLTQLPEAVARETGQTISEGELRIRAGQGWFPLLPGAGDDGTEEGSPLYIPSRIGLFLKLQKEGYSTDELRVVAEYEEGLIDDVLVTHELTYADDDVEVLLLHTQERVDSLEQCFDSNGIRIDRTAEVERARRDLDLVKKLRAEGIPDRLSKTIARQAFRVRAFNEWLRLELLDHERSKIAAGYSPFVRCSSESWNKDRGFRGGPIRWQDTVRSALAFCDKSDAASIRIPEFLLRGDRIIPTRTLRPGEYSQLWKEYDLDAYLECWVRLRGERRCLNCLGALPEDSDERKRFCSEKCRNAAKQRRHRERNPDSVERAQQRYWQSLDC
jgi:predicted nucleic acid-binding Zn ribbon protein